MKMRLISLALCLVLILSLAACSAEPQSVTVERVAMLLAASQIQDRYAGIVVSEDVVKVDRDMSKDVKNLYVTVGQDVEAGDRLFSYDSDQLSLSLEVLQLDLAKLNNQVTTIKNQIKDLNKRIEEAKKNKNESSANYLTLDLQSKQLDQIQAEHDVAAKQKEIDRVKEMLRNVDVYAPVAGRIKTIASESDYSDGAYITIQKTGAYRIKGTLNEMSRAGGIMEGVGVRILSRLDDSMAWVGYVSMVDYENGSQNQNDNYYWGGGSDANATGYPFYVELDMTDGLLLGQHVYIEVDRSELVRYGVWVPTRYLTEISEDGTTAKVFMAGADGTLESRTVELGMFDPEIGCYQITNGLSERDYIADPSQPGCKVGSHVEYRDEGDFGIELPPEGVVVPGDYCDGFDDFGDVGFDDGFVADDAMFGDDTGGEIPEYEPEEGVEEESTQPTLIHKVPLSRE